MVQSSVRSALASIVLLVAVSASAQPAAPYGAESPQALVAAMEKAIATDDLVAAMPLVSPDGRRELADEGVSGLLMALAFSNPDDPMPGSKPLPKAELDKRKKGYASAVDLVRQTLRPHGLDSLIGQPPMAPKSQETLKAALAKADTVVLVTSLLTAMDRIGPMLGMQKSDSKKVPFTFGKVTNFQVKGDRATAKAATEVLEFERVQGRWYLKPPTQ